MSNLAEVFYGHLITAVGSDVGNRITPFPIPANQTLPAVTYRRVYGASKNRHTVAGNPTTFYESRWQVDIFSTTYAATEIISAKVVSYFDAFEDTASNPKIVTGYIDMHFLVREEMIEAYRSIVDVHLFSTSP